jgi:predicted RNase H-like HicB family nuclease
MITMNKYTAVIQRDGNFWIGWIEEISGVSSQGATRAELLKNFHSALQEALQMNRFDARNAAGNAFEEIQIPA